MNHLKSTPLSLVAAALTTLAIFGTTAAVSIVGAAKGSPYPLATCPVSGQPLGKDATIFVMEDAANSLNDGREIRFCCPKCVATFTAEPTKFLPAIDAAIIAQQSPRYPLTHCLVMTEDELPLAGSPDFDKVKDVVVLNNMIRLCCPGCVKKIKKDPLKFVAQVEAAVIAAQKKSYPLTTCPISGEVIDADSADIVIGERLVRLCCNGCADKARQDPTSIFAKLDAASTKNAPATPIAPTAPATPIKSN
ncbi:MAG: hypothetical protein EXS15_07295 [Phycisphaerales bacterium]|nr:hypothetical protein [Phycisphaerales bacterium]